MNSIYQLKTGEAIDLSQIVQIGNLRKKGIKRPHEFEIILKTASCKIVLNAYPVGDEMRKAYDSEIKDYSGQERAEEAATEVYKTFCEEVRTGLINAWKQFKEKHGS